MRVIDPEELPERARTGGARVRDLRLTPKSERPRCGAKTRRGTPCQAPAAWDKVRDQPRNGRCRLHGGLSTGARTPAGRARLAAAQRRRWARWRAERARGEQDSGGA
ncbi:MAG: HGGxSTG domain-containing protein [Planctomycetota bacterium]